MLSLLLCYDKKKGKKGKKKCNEKAYGDIYFLKRVGWEIWKINE